MKCVVRRFLCANVIVYLHKPRWYSLLHTLSTGVLKVLSTTYFPMYFFFHGKNISFDTSLVLYINSTNIPPIMIINRIYEHQNILSLQLLPFLVGLRTYQHLCKVDVTPLKLWVRGLCVDRQMVVHNKCKYF
jgi:hypothetical protein